MRKRMYTTGLAVMCGLVLTATGLWASAASEAEPAAAADREMVRDPSTGQMILKPQYGGSIAEAWTSDPPHTDTWWGSSSRDVVSFFLEKLGIGDWGLDRDTFDFKSNFTPESVLRGQLAESVEVVSPTELVFHIRPGVYWHDKAPMNGRELVADDIVFSFNRMTGLGSDFAEKSPGAGSITNLPIESIEATDKYTVVFKLSELNLNALPMIYNEAHSGGWIYPPEVIEQYGHMQDWKTAVGTGPYMLTDWVKGSAITYTKNPNYWGHDEKFPENRLPYLDEVKALIIPDPSTRLTALRTGQIARLINVTFDEANTIRNTNPELPWTSVLGVPWTFAMDVRKPPFDDIRVRTAMQLALDTETINDTLFGGLGDTTPYGVAGPATIGFSTPYAEWPQEIKDNYAYDPERAKQLLAEAGYPDGFETKLEYPSENSAWHNTDHAQLAVAYWAEIGVDVELDLNERAVVVPRINAHTYEGMTYGMRSNNWNPPVFIRVVGYSDHMWNAAGAQDPVYDAMVDAVDSAASREEQMELTRKADDYFIAQQWVTSGPLTPSFSFWQPWIVGFNGEFSLGGGYYNAHLPRVWIDADLREEMTGTR